MPTTLSYPGVYVEEIPSGVRTIVGVSTSNTLFIDFFPKGPVNDPVRVTSYGDFERVFGGLHPKSEASYAIKQYYLNGGQVAFVVRAKPEGQGVALPEKAAVKLTLNGRPDDVTVVFTVEAINEGDWGNQIQVAVDHQTARDPVTGLPKDNEFNLVVRLLGLVSGRLQVLQQEIHRNLSMEKASPRSAVEAVSADSRLVRLVDLSAGVWPGATWFDGPAGASVTTADIVSDVRAGDPTLPQSGGASGGSGAPNSRYVFRSQKDASDKAGKDGDVPDLLGYETAMKSLDAIAPEIFNIMCLPAVANFRLPNQPSVPDDASYDVVISSATKVCRDKRAFLIVDVPESVKTDDEMMTCMGSKDTLRDPNAAVYFPRVTIADPLNQNRAKNVGPSGTIAGIFAATDANRGVWKAPAGTDASLGGATLATRLSDLENGGLNPFGINALRSFPIFGDVVWGARTLEGADIQASEWKYIPIRRTALFIEESLYQGLKWVVFEPNDEPLWAQIRLNVGAFMHNLFRQGAFQGSTPAKAYLVKCDSETTTQTDIDLGIVNIVVGFAPLKPAEFVVLRIQQLAGQIAV